MVEVNREEARKVQALIVFPLNMKLYYMTNLTSCCSADEFLNTVQLSTCKRNEVTERGITLFISLFLNVFF